MENNQQVSTAESEAHRLVKKSFEKVKSGPTVYHNYYLRYPLNDSEYESISAADLPAILRAVEDNERKQPTAEEIQL